MQIETVKLQQNGYLLNGTMLVPMAPGNSEYELIKQWISEGNTPEPADVYVAPVPTVITALQARLALNEMGIRQSVEDAVAIANQDVKDFYEFATEWKRDNTVLLDMAVNTLGMTEAEIDNFFILASSK